MRIVSITSPLLTLALLLQAPGSFAQEESDDVSEEEYIDEEDEEILDEEVTEDTPPSDSKSSSSTSSGEESAAEDLTEEPGEEESLWEPGEEPYRSAPAGKGVIWGRLVDNKDGEPAIEAEVKVAGRNLRVYTDFDGYYRLELPPGSYKLEVFYELHEPETLDGVVSLQGQVRRQDVQLTPQAGAIEEVLIQDAAEMQTVEGLALVRQRSLAQGDAVGREEISKTTDSNAAEAAQRVVGANIIGGRFVYVRGLGERYSNSLLSMYPLPSPEPDRAAVPLDVFPASILDSLTIAKTFMVDSPGDFAGGSVQIETRSVPAKPLFNVSLSGGYNTQSTFQQRLDHPSSGTDWLGMDSGMRGLPSSVPTDYPAKAGAQRPDGSLVERGSADLIRAGRDMNSPMASRFSDTPINHSVSVVGGNTWDLGKGQKLGFLASVNYSRKYEKYENAIMREFRPSTLDERGYEYLSDYRVDRGMEAIRWGAFGKLSYIISPEHKISLTGFHSQLADDKTSYFQGRNIESQGEFAATQLDWVERGLTFGVLSGRHEFKALNDAEFGWDLSLAKAYRYEPDRRDTVYQKNYRLPGEVRGERQIGWTYTNSTSSGRHFWSEQSEDSNGGKIDWRQPILKGDTEAALKFGGLINVKQREFSARRFQMLPDPRLWGREQLAYSCVGEQYDKSCPNSLFQDENIGSYLHLDEGSQQGDAYDAHLNVYAGYAMTDIDLSKKLRIAAGARVEWTDQQITPRAPMGGSVTIKGADLRATDVLPAVSLVYSGTKELKTRFSYSQTLARPQLRELAPFAFADYFGGRTVAGNPDLQLTRINNLDARLEYWPSLSEVLAFTVFYKQLQDPIEQVLVPTGGNPMLTFRNSDGAKLIGAEFEVRKNLGFLTSVLSPFSVISNLTLAWSRTQIQQTGQITMTSLYRALTNQAPWVFNAALDYENEHGTNARVTYNVNGPTLVEVGTMGIPDGYLHPFHSLDFSISQKFAEHWSVRGSIENIVNDDHVITQGAELAEENITRQFRTGSVFTIGLGYSL